MDNLFTDVFNSKDFYTDTYNINLINSLISIQT